jgi:hypothetical protein
MNILNLNLGGIRNTFASFNLINISLNNKISEENLNQVEENKIPIPIEKQAYKDAKTVLAGNATKLIEAIVDDVVVYLFLGKEKQSYSAWNTLIPVVLEKSTQRIHQYGPGCFALEGSGGGLSNTSSLLHYLKLHKEKGFSVQVLPFVIDESCLHDFEYADSGIGLTELKVEATQLSLYRKREFVYIHDKLERLKIEYGI